MIVPNASKPKPPTKRIAAIIDNKATKIKGPSIMCATYNDITAAAP